MIGAKWSLWLIKTAYFHWLKVIILIVWIWSFWFIETGHFYWLFFLASTWYTLYSIVIHQFVKPVILSSHFDSSGLTISFYRWMFSVAYNGSIIRCHSITDWRKTLRTRWVVICGSGCFGVSSSSQAPDTFDCW